MTVWLKQSTSVVVQVGPFLDKTDGVALETGLVSALDNATTGIRVAKNGGTLAARNATVTASSYDAMGLYKVTLDTTDTGTLGVLRLVFEEAATCLPVWQDFMVVPANVWDAMFGADKLDVSVVEWLGTAAATPTVAGVPEVDLTHVAGATTNVSALATKVDAIPTTAMRGTDSAALASVVTEARMSELDEATAGKMANQVDEIRTDTGEIGTAGAGLTGLGGMSTTMKGQVNAEADTAASDYGANTTTPPTAVAIRTEIDSNSTQLASILSKMLKYFQLALRKDAAIATDNATEVTAINANEGSGAGAYDNATEGQEAIRDQGDSAWPTATAVDLNADQSSVTIGTVTTNTDMVGTDGALTDKAGFSLSTAGILAIWHQLTSAIVTASTIGKLITDFLDAAISSRHASGAAVSSVSGAVGSVAGNVDGSVGSVTGHTNQTGDTYALANGANGFVATKAAVDAILPAKNTALSNIELLMVDSTDNNTPKTGLTLTVTRSIDGGAFASATGTAAEVANGIYQFDASAADMNGTIITFRFTGTAADDRFLTIRTSG